MKRILFFLLLLTSVSLSAQNTHVAPVGEPSPSTGSKHHYGKVFNIVDYGAKGDGKRVVDGAMGATTTTFTSATANFTSADVGKSIRVPAAGGSGHDLITTIASVSNSTTVILSASSVGAVSGKKVVYGSDNTAAIQNAIWADSANGGGTVWIPKGVFIVSGSLVTSAFGANPNSQIYFPICSSVSGFQNRTHYIIEGEIPPEFVPMNFAVDTLAALSGSVIYSLIDGSGNLPSIFGTKASNGVSNISFNYFTFKNLSIFVSQNVSNNGPSIGGINMYYSASLICDKVLVCADGSIGASVKPTNEVAGIISSAINSEIESEFNNIEVGNFKYGLITFDDALINNALAVICQNAFVFPRQEENIQANYLKAYWCNVDVFVPNAAIGTYISAGPTYFKINNLVSEVFVSSGNWYDYTNVVSDAGNNAIADISYTIIQAGVAWNNSLFNKSGGTGIVSYPIGSIPLPPVIALGTSNSAFYSFSAAFSDLTGGGSQFPGVFLQNTSSTSPGASQYNFAPFTSVSGNGAVVAQFSANFGSGATAPFTTQGVVMGSRTNHPLIFFQNSNQISRIDATGFNPFTTASFDLGTSSLVWRDIYLSHPIGESAIGVSSGLGTNVSSLTPAGNDAYFSLTVVTSGNVSGTVGLVAFGRTWGATPHCTISVANAATGTASIGGYFGLNATSASSMTMVGSLTGAGTYIFQCHCAQ